MSVYEGFYYDGQSAKAHLATIALQPEDLVIMLVSEEISEETPIIWEYHSIQRISKYSQRPVMLKYGQFPHQVLEIKNDTFLAAIRRNNPDARFAQEHIEGAARLNNKGVAIAVATIIGFLALLYCYVLPAALNFMAMHFPVSLEEQMGTRMLNSFINVNDIEPLKTVQANNFFAQLHTNTRYNVYITVVKSPIKNAFALPGGQIIIFSAILDDIKHSDELVALLGHELGHIEHRHTLRMLFQSLSNYILIAAIMQNTNGIASVLASNAASLYQLSYSRTLEAESDDFGYQLMLQNHVNPQGMVNLFENLKKTDEVGARIPEFLTTHPALDKRMTNIKSKLSTKASFQTNPNLETTFQLLTNK